MKKSNYMGLFFISICCICLIPSIVYAGGQEPPVDHEIEPTSFDVPTGWHTSGTLSDVYTKNGVKMGFQQYFWWLTINFNFPSGKYDTFLFAFSDTTPFACVHVDIYYTTGPPVTIMAYRSDGYYSASLDNSKIMYKAKVYMNIAFGQWLHIDYLIAYKN